MAKPSAIPGVMLPLNGQYCTIEDFLRRIETAIEAANNFDNGVARPIGQKAKHDIKKMMSDFFKQD